MKKIVFLLIISVLPLLSISQVQLMDLSIKNLVTVNASTDSVELLIQFKLNPISQAQSINFMFGTAPGQNNIFSGTANVSQQGQIYSIEYGGKSTPVKNYEAQIFCILSQSQYNLFQNATVNVVIQGGGQSQNIVWSK